MIFPRWAELPFYDDHCSELDDGWWERFQETHIFDDKYMYTYTYIHYITLD